MMTLRHITSAELRHQQKGRERDKTRMRKRKENTTDREREKEIGKLSTMRFDLTELSRQKIVLNFFTAKSKTFVFNFAFFSFLYDLFTKKARKMEII